ncbi:arginase family protein [Microbacterium sp. YY-01]|uniref:arginase family protein n=1 Tax=Microbacterium sp. YY-01 TaxID=3421634 RepID=UPI003D1627F6
MAQFVVVPQWQGSSAPRAMLLADGASAIAGDLPRARTQVLDVPLEAGDALDSGVQRLSSLQRVRDVLIDSLHETLQRHPEDHAVVIGGDSGISPAVLSALAVDPDDTALLWCSAQPGLCSPTTSVSGAFTDMAVRAMLADEKMPLAATPGIAPEKVILVGARSAENDDAQLRERMTSVGVDQLADPASLAQAVARTGATRVFVHIDVDVLDPSSLSGVFTPAPFGASPSELATALRTVREHTSLAGACLAGFAPASPLDAVNDLGSILRLIGALA